MTKPTKQDAERLNIMCGRHVMKVKMNVKYFGVSKGIAKATYKCGICGHEIPDIIVGHGKKTLCPQCEGIPPSKIKGLKELWKQPVCQLCKGTKVVYTWD